MNRQVFKLSSKIREITYGTEEIHWEGGDRLPGIFFNCNEKTFEIPMDSAQFSFNSMLKVRTGGR